MGQVSAFTGFFDAAGHPSDRPYVIVSGYVANFLQWQFFENMWRNVHEQYGVEMPFHASGFHARAKATNQYSKWAIDDPEADRFIAALCTAQQLHMLASFSCKVDMGTYKNINDVFMLDTMLPAYAVAVRVCVETVQTWQKAFGLNHPVECIFEDGDFGRGKFIDLMRVERMPAPIFRDKKDYAGLQAADHLAWEQGNYTKRLKLAEGIIPVTSTLSKMLAIPHIHHAASLDNLLEICEKKGVPIKRSNIVIP